MVLPGAAQLGFVVALILVVAVEAGVESFAGARDGGFEARGLPDDEVGGDASVGPAANAQLVGIGDALRDGVVDHGHIVLVVLIAPIRENRFGVAFASTGRTARVGKQDGVAIGGEQLREMGELGIVGPDGSAVRAKDRGILLARRVIEGLIEVAADRGAVFTLELDVFGLNELELGKEGVVGLGDAREVVARDRLPVDFAGAVGHVDLGGNVAILAEGIGVEHEAAGNRTGDIAAGDGNAGENLRAVVIGDEVDGAAVGREARLGGVAVEGLGENAGRAASGRRDGNVMCGVLEEVRVELSGVGKELAVRRPSRLGVVTGIGGDLG